MDDKLKNFETVVESLLKVEPENKINVCKNCKHVRWLLALGFGVRCGEEHNKDKHFVEKDSHHERLGPLVPSRYFTCEYFEKK